jgi:phage terminase large subunit-like protein
MQLIKDTIHHFDPVIFARNNFAFECDEWQKDVLLSADKKIILNCCRQSGKSTISAIKAVHKAIYFPGSLVLIVSPSQRQSSELFKKVSELIGTLPEQPKKIEDNRLSVTFDNKSRIVSLPSQEATVRGFSAPDLVVIDEAARVSDSLYFAIRPMLAVSKGQLILLSTPFGRRGFFHDEWEGTAGSWKKVLITADQCSRISEEFLEDEKRVLGDWFFEQEYYCMFKETVDSVFTAEQIEAAFDDDLEPWHFGGV